MIETMPQLKQTENIFFNLLELASDGWCNLLFDEIY